MCQTRKLFVTLGIFLVCYWGTTSAAEWAEVIRAEDFIGYVDLSSIRSEEGGAVIAWKMNDYFSPQAFMGHAGVRSDRMLVEFQCNEKRHRGRKIILYDQQTGGGNILAASEITIGWQNIVAQSEGEYNLTFVCNYVKKNKK